MFLLRSLSLLNCFPMFVRDKDYLRRNKTKAKNSGMFLRFVAQGELIQKYGYVVL